MRNLTPISVSPELSRAFATMSFICAGMIVYRHTGCSAEGEVIGEYFNRFLMFVCRVAIPWFFFAAGFFLAGHVHEHGWYFSELKKRVRSLLVPFWIWGVIICLFYAGVCALAKTLGYAYHGVDYTTWLSVKGLLRIAGLDPFGTMHVLWFLRTLFLLVVISPIVIRLGKPFMVVVAVSYLTFEAVSLPEDSRVSYILSYFVSLRGVMWYSLGIMFRLSAIQFRTYIKKTVIMAGFVCLVLRMLVDGRWGGVCDFMMVPGLMMFFLQISYSCAIPKAVLSCSFPLYLMHSMIVFSISAIYGVIGVGGMETTFALGLLKFAFALVLSIVASMSLRRWFPSFAIVAFGGRL